MRPECSSFPGSRVTPDDPRYPTLIRGFNQRWVGHPEYVEVGDAGRAGGVDAWAEPRVSWDGIAPLSSFDGLDS